MNQRSPHPLGPLAALAAEAQEWHSRDRGLGGTWAGLWLPSQQDSILATVAAHADCIDDADRRRLARQGVLPGVRDYGPLWALLSSRPADTIIEEPVTEETPTESTPAGLPIWHHGTFEQARLTTSQQAIHLVRYLDDFHEVSLAALRRYRLRTLKDASPHQRVAVCQEVVGARRLRPGALIVQVREDNSARER